MKTKSRKARVWGLLNSRGFGDAHLTPTATQNLGNEFYVQKDDTRVAGPWRDAHREFIPDEYKIDLWDWQKQLLAVPRVSRKINIMVDPTGSLGKSQCWKWCKANGKRVYRCFANATYSEIIKHMCDKLMAAQDHNPQYVFIDIPKAVDPKTWGAAMMAAEVLMDGWLEDGRYKHSEWLINYPIIWICCNRQPKLNQLSRDRWVFWEVRDDKLVKI